VDVAEANEVVRGFGAEHQRTVLSDKRETLSSALFAVPRRAALVNGLFFDEGPGLIRELLEFASPETIGAAMKRPGSRPYALNLWIVMGAYLSGRQQTLLDRGVSPGEPVRDTSNAEVLEIVDFYVRTARAYREDGQLFASGDRPNQTVLSPETVGEALELATQPTPTRRAAVNRVAASLSLYNFILHGEHRDGTFGHGPYDGPDATTVWFEEFTDLRSDVLPWAATAQLPVDKVVLVYAAEDVSIEVSIFGALRVTPTDFDDRLTRIAAFTVDDDAAVALSDDDLEEIAQAADARLGLLFARAAAYPGPPPFLKHLVTAAPGQVYNPIA
jgi:hypothetical protein